MVKEDNSSLKERKNRVWRILTSLQMWQWTHCHICLLFVCLFVYCSFVCLFFKQKSICRQKYILLPTYDKNVEPIAKLHSTQCIWVVKRRLKIVYELEGLHKERMDKCFTSHGIATYFDKYRLWIRRENRSIETEKWRVLEKWYLKWKKSLWTYIWIHFCNKYHNYRNKGQVVAASQVYL